MSETVIAPREADPPAPIPTSESGKPAPTAAQPNEDKQPKQERDPMLDLLDKFEKVSAAIVARDPGMAAGLNRLVKQSSKPGRTEQPMFRTQVAYMLQDVEKMAGATPVSVRPELRAELTKLAATGPGLENRQMEALVKGTPDINDRGVIRDVRRAAASIAGMGDQNSAQVKETIEVLENRMRLATRFSAGQAMAPAEPAVTGPKSGETPRVVSNDTLARPQGEGPAERVRAAASPGDDAQRIVSEPQRNQQPSYPAQATNTDNMVSAPARPKGILSSVMDNARAPSGGRAPWEPPPIAMKLRVAAFEETLASGRTDQHIRAAEKSGQALMQSMEIFMTGPGAGVLGKIESAASTEPGGMKAVMSEMQPGGRYASLRSEFDNALQQDRAFAASFSAVEKATGQYGQDRLTLGADFQARKLDATQLDARFQRADAAIGEAAEKIPGRAPGQNLMAEMAETVSEMLSKAVDRMKHLFGKEAEAGPKASSSPGMSP